MDYPAQPDPCQAEPKADVALACSFISAPESQGRVCQSEPQAPARGLFCGTVGPNDNPLACAHGSDLGTCPFLLGPGGPALLYFATFSRFGL